MKKSSKRFIRLFQKHEAFGKSKSDCGKGVFCIGYKSKIYFKPLWRSNVPQLWKVSRINSAWKDIPKRYIDYLYYDSAARVFIE